VGAQDAPRAPGTQAAAHLPVLLARLRVGAAGGVAVRPRPAPATRAQSHVLSDARARPPSDGRRAPAGARAQPHAAVRGPRAGVWLAGAGGRAWHAEA